MLCTDLTLVKKTERGLWAEPLKCKRWSCEWCSEMRRVQLKFLAKDGHPDSFLTLTVNPAFGLSPTDRARLLARSWRLLRKRIMRRFDLKKLPFLAVFEATKRGEPHLHILMRSPYLPQAWLSEQMYDLMRAPTVWIERIKNKKKAAAYIAKYIGKDPHHFPGTKRYWRSQDWLDPVAHQEFERRRETGEWWVQRESWSAYIQKAAHLGFDVEHAEGGAWLLYRGPP